MGSIGTLEKHIILRIARNLHGPRRSYKMGPSSNEVEELLSEAFSNLEFRARQHVPIFVENGIRDIEPGRLGDCQEKDSALQPVGLKRRRHHNVRVHDESKRNHLCLVFLPRVARMTLSICSEVKASTPFAFDSSPMIVRTSGSGAASRT